MDPEAAKALTVVLKVLIRQNQEIVRQLQIANELLVYAAPIGGGNKRIQELLRSIHQR